MCAIAKSIDNFYSHRITILQRDDSANAIFAIVFATFLSCNRSVKFWKYCQFTSIFFVIIILSLIIIANSAISYKVQCAYFHIFELNSNNFQPLLYLNFQNVILQFCILTLTKHSLPKNDLTLQILIKFVHVHCFRPLLCPYLNEFSERIYNKQFLIY